MTVVVGGAPAGEVAETARAARLAAEAAARAGVPLLLLQPAPLSASWEALALYPHEDVLAQVTPAPVAPGDRHAIWDVIKARAVPGGRGPMPCQGLATRRFAARGQCAQRRANCARRRGAGAARAPVAAQARGRIAQVGIVGIAQVDVVAAAAVTSAHA